MAHNQKPWLLAATPGDDWKERMTGSPKDTKYQVAIMSVGGALSLIAFLLLRRSLPNVYAARKRQRSEADCLPDLPDSLFGWMGTVYSVSEDQVLASVGLDAFVFLRFFKLAIKLLLVMLFFALVVIAPVQSTFPEEDPKPPHNKTNIIGWSAADMRILKNKDDDDDKKHPDSFLWLYFIFAWLYTGLAYWLLFRETLSIINKRQEYLGTQSSATDRTLRLSGIPGNLRTEAKIKQEIEDLEIGKVEKVYLCRDTYKLDYAIADRRGILRNLETAAAKYRKKAGKDSKLPKLVRQHLPGPGDEENDRLLDAEDGHANHTEDPNRPKHRIWFGRFNLQTKKVDSLGYWERKLDDQDQYIEHLREQEHKAMPMAFVTMDSTAACQMAIQAVLTPSPLQLIATPSPPPRHVNWKNTYISRRMHLIRNFGITLVIVLLTVVWSVVLAPLAGLLNLENIQKALPGFAHFIEKSTLLKSVVQTQLPTIFIALLNVAVPYLYGELSRYQGYISRGDMELSVISKNFFFTYFNFFIVFTALGSAALSFQGWGDRTVKETALSLARSIEGLRAFYVNYIILQAAFLNFFRLLDGGSLFFWAWGRLTATTPREKREIIQPSYFTFGYSLPTTLLLFLICIVYSGLRDSWQVLLPGILYFVVGYFVYKYQLLYAYNIRQHSTGRTWVLIFNRIIVGVFIFQVVMAGQLALRGAWQRSVAVSPLILVTIVFTYQFRANYEPLMTYIALKSIHRARERDHGVFGPRDDGQAANYSTPEDTEGIARRFVNPNLWKPLEKPWIEGERNGRVPRSGVASDVSSETQLNGE